MEISEFFLLGLGGGSFAVGIVVGMLLYRALWFIDTHVLLQEIEELKVGKKNLLDDVLRMSNELAELRQRLDYMDKQESDLRADLRMAAKRERAGL